MTNAEKVILKQAMRIIQKLVEGDKKDHTHGIGLACTDCFIRETPKGCPTCGHPKEMGAVSRCVSDFHREIPQLPDPIENVTGFGLVELATKFNSLIDYLKAHETN